MSLLRIYLDTSVVGGYFDPEFELFSRRLLARLNAGEAIPLVSEVLAAELEKAPPAIRRLVDGLYRAEAVELTDEMRVLAEHYLAAKIVTKRYATDALHIAVATVAKADVLVSWNFKHIVNLEKIRRFNAVNLAHGYPEIEIRTPREVINYEKK